MRREGRRELHHRERRVKGSEAGKLVLEEQEAGRKLGQELFSHLKDRQTEGWGVGATCLDLTGALSSQL